MANNPELLKHLELASQRLRHHHSALWEEEKHYTWWVYVVFGALIFIYANQFLDTCQKIIVIGFGSVFGLLMSIIGFHVVRREGEQFHEALQEYHRTVIALGLNRPFPRPDGGEPINLMEGIEKKDFKSVKSQANKPLHKLIAGVLKGGLGIRDCFQLIFFISGLLFIGFFFISVITLN